MQIQIHIPRPWQTLFAVAFMFFWMTGPFWPSAFGSQKAAGGSSDGAHIAHAQQNVDRERIVQAVLNRREEILRYQVQVLEDEASRAGNVGGQEELNEHRLALLDVVRQRAASEQLLTASIVELWDSQGTLISRNAGAIAVQLQWPLEPIYGISAHFEDDGYEERFGLPHHAIDIPAEQGTAIRAAADGVVSKVALNGMGYSYLIVDHGDGVETLYGHISAALVSEGDQVRMGSPIARSGGRPGSPGAGLLTTGPHLHFSVRKDSALVDPLKYLPELD